MAKERKIDVITLIEQLQARGVQLVRGGETVLAWPPEALSEDERASLEENQGDLAMLLATHTDRLVERAASHVIDKEGWDRLTPEQRANPLNVISRFTRWQRR